MLLFFSDFYYVYYSFDKNQIFECKTMKESFVLFVVKDEVSPRLLDSVGYYVGSTVVCVQNFFWYEIR